MNNFRLPNWVLFSGIFVNLWMTCFCFIMGDKIATLLGILCIGCFIFTYRINQRERNEKKQINKKDDKGSSLR